MMLIVLKLIETAANVVVYYLQRFHHYGMASLSAVATCVSASLFSSETLSAPFDSEMASFSTFGLR